MGLTKREIEVALLILKDLSNVEIATELFISETTVKRHITNIFKKVGIQARGELKKNSDLTREKKYVSLDRI